MYFDIVHDSEQWAADQIVSIFTRSIHYFYYTDVRYSHVERCLSGNGVMQYDNMGSAHDCLITRLGLLNEKRFSKLVYLLAGKIIQKEIAGAATQLIAPVKIGFNGD